MKEGENSDRGETHEVKQRDEENSFDNPDVPGAQLWWRFRLVISETLPELGGGDELWVENDQADEDDGVADVRDDVSVDQVVKGQRGLDVRGLPEHESGCVGL